MLVGTATSKNGTRIRLTEERWLHIISAHPEISPTEYPEILDAVENPRAVLKGEIDELLAIKEKPSGRYWLVVVYKEASKRDGFIITTYKTTDARWLFKKEIIWSKES
jgi:hypothetical protein